MEGNNANDVISALQDPHPSVRKAALEALHYGSNLAPHLGTVVAMLQDPDDGVRRAAVAALSRIDVAAAHAGAIVAMLQDPAARVRRSAVCALKPIGQAAAAHAGAIVAMLQHPDEGVRLAALAALGYIGQAAAHAGTIVAMLQDSTPKFQLVAARFLFTLGWLEAGHHAFLLQLQFKLQNRAEKREVGTILSQVKALCPQVSERNPHISNLSHASLGIALHSMKHLGRHCELTSRHIETVLVRCNDDVELDELILALNRCRQTAAIFPHLQQLQTRTAASSTWVPPQNRTACSSYKTACAAQNLASSALSMIATKCLKWQARTHVFSMVWKQCLAELPRDVVISISKAMH